MYEVCKYIENLQLAIGGVPFVIYSGVSIYVFNVLNGAKSNNAIKLFGKFEIPMKALKFTDVKMKIKFNNGLRLPQNEMYKIYAPYLAAILQLPYDVCERILSFLRINYKPRLDLTACWDNESLKRYGRGENINYISWKLYGHNSHTFKLSDRIFFDQCSMTHQVMILITDENDIPCKISIDYIQFVRNGMIISEGDSEKYHKLDKIQNGYDIPEELIYTLTLRGRKPIDYTNYDSTQKIRTDIILIANNISKNSNVHVICINKVRFSVEYGKASRI